MCAINTELILKFQNIDNCDDENSGIFKCPFCNKFVCLNDDSLGEMNANDNNLVMCDDCDKFEYMCAESEFEYENKMKHYHDNIKPMIGNCNAIMFLSYEYEILKDYEESPGEFLEFFNCPVEYRKYKLMKIIEIPISKYYYSDVKLNQDTVLIINDAFKRDEKENVIKKYNLIYDNRREDMRMFNVAIEFNGYNMMDSGIHYNFYSDFGFCCKLENGDIRYVNYD